MGGGVGLSGKGTTGTGGHYNVNGDGEDGVQGSYDGSGNYGGGGAAGGYLVDPDGAYTFNYGIAGAQGAVRIIWAGGTGINREFPSTNTQNM